MRECGECKLCCQGLLTGNTRGSWFGNLVPCKYLDNKCTIYEDRPSQCRDYYCTWAQELLPLWMQPNLINVIVSVEIDETGKQFLNIISSNKVSNKIISEINKFTQTNNSYFKQTRIIPIRSTNVSIL